MARFDVYATGKGQGYLLDVQADLLDGYNTRIVVPLRPPKVAPLPADRLNPQFEINGTAVSMVTQFMAAIPRSELKTPVTNLDAHASEILSAIDFLIHGW